MKKLLLIVLLIVSYIGAFAQGTEVFKLMNNPANALGSGNYPDSTRAATAYYFESPQLNAMKEVSIQCYTKKDSGTVSGHIFIEGSNDPATPGSAKVWQTLVVSAGDSLLFSNGDNGRFWQYNQNTTIKPMFKYWRAHLNLTAISRSRVKCYIKGVTY